MAEANCDKAKRIRIDLSRVRAFFQSNVVHLQGVSLYSSIAVPYFLGRPTKMYLEFMINLKNDYDLIECSSVNSFDNGLYGINDFETAGMDPQQTLLLECTNMAMVDGGFTRDKLAGSDTAVYIGMLMFLAIKEI